MPKTDFIIAGVGGQGVILASDLLGEVALATGRDVKKADVIGMAQRGGEVVSHIRWGDKVYSPLIKRGGADYLLGMEKLEAARWAAYLAPGGLAVVNDHSILPMTVTTGGTAYPTDDVLFGALRQRTDRVFVLDGQALAQANAVPGAVNLLLLGYMAWHMGIAEELWLDAIARRVPTRFLQADQQAFLLGYHEAQKVGATV